MGQTLSEPVTTKDSSSVQNSVYRVGASNMQGWRVTMEDWHTHILSLPEDPEAAFFAVYDGHGGAKVAQYAGHHLHTHITSHPSYPTDIPAALRLGFLSFDESMQKDEQMRDELAGTTAITVLIRGDTLHCANVGDSRAIAGVKGVGCVALSRDHKPSNAEESARITKAGGWVEYNRVNGNLALSRALGDFVFKRNPTLPPSEQMVTALPDVTTHTLDPNWEFLVLACDGIWDVLTNEEVVEFVRRRIGWKVEPEAICEELMSTCLAPDCQMGGLGCDNMTVIVVCLLRGRSWEEYCRGVMIGGEGKVDVKDDEEEEDIFEDAKDAHHNNTTTNPNSSSSSDDENIVLNEEK